MRLTLVAAGDLVPVEEFILRRRTTRARVSHDLLMGSAFVIEHDGADFVPAFLADPTLDQRRVRRICRLLRPCTGWERWLFFSTPKLSLQRRTPLQAMRDGSYRDVARIAAGCAER